MHIPKTAGLLSNTRLPTGVTVVRECCAEPSAYTLIVRKLLADQNWSAQGHSQHNRARKFNYLKSTLCEQENSIHSDILHNPFNANMKHCTIPHNHSTNIIHNQNGKHLHPINIDHSHKMLFRFKCPLAYQIQRAKDDTTVIRKTPQLRASITLTC